MRRFNYFKTLGIILMLIIPLALSAKKVICVDGGGDPFLNCHEGWERQNMADGDVILVGGSLTDCLDQVETGDELVIIAHGYNSGEGFIWGGSYYEGFGEGEDEMPVPADFASKDSVDVRFCTCWSGRTPAGGTPLTDDIGGTLGSGGSVTGYTDLHNSKLCFKLVGGTPAQIAAAKDSLSKNGSWGDNPPHNRDPSPDPSDQSGAQDIVDGKVGAGVITVTITYKAPEGATSITETSGGVVIGCDFCEDGCGLLTYMFENIPDVPYIPVTDEMILPFGLYRSDAIIDFYFPEGDPQFVQISNLRLYNMPVQMPIPEPGMEMIFSTPVESFFDISYDQGHSFETGQAFGEITLLLSVPFTPGDPGGSQHIDTEIVSMNLSGTGPVDMMQVTIDPMSPAQGVTSFDNDDGFLSASVALNPRLNLSVLGAPPSTTCLPSVVYLACPSPTVGCTNPAAPNFELCAIADDGSCIMPHGGCTYPTASNYDATASFENYSCVFPVLCKSDLNNDGTVGVPDLLEFLADFGNDCPPPL